MKIVLKKENITFNNGKTVNIYNVYEITKNESISSSYTVLENCLFDEIGLIKNSTIEKYKFNGYGIGFDGKGNFSRPSGGFGQKLLTFGVDKSSSVHANNKKTSIFVLDELIIQIANTKLYAEKMYSLNFTKNNKKFCLSLHYNGANSYLFVNGTEIIKFKAEVSEIVANPLYVGNISKETTAGNGVDKTSLYEQVYGFSDDNRPAAINDILYIQKYLMKKNDI